MTRPLLTALAVATATGGAAQAPDPAPVPFGPGERAEYEVKLGFLSVGDGVMEVTGIQSVDGHPTYHTRFTLKGGIPFARVDDTFESWIDVEGVFSRRFRQDQKEINFERKRTYHFYPERKSWRREDGSTGTLPTDEPLDDVSFLYYARTLPLEVGETYTLDRYFKEDGNPVVLHVLRKETITVPAGTFRTVVVRPVIQTDGLFSEGGEAEVYFSDDDRRLVVSVKSRVPLIGSLHLLLREYTAGRSFAARR
ncbi:MAG: DUF3108 domain-containing protein [Longimicrobiaceae bacterium]